MDRIKRTFTITKDWIPLPWKVYDVVPLFSSSGELLAYAEKEYRRTATGIPTEIFNHQLTKVRPYDPMHFASFMSRFGLLGSPRPRDRRVKAIMDVQNEADAKAADKLYRFKIAPATPEKRLAWYQDMQRAAAEAGLNWKGSADAINDPEVGRMFVTAQDALDTYSELITASEVAKALAHSDKISDIAKYLDIPESNVLDHVVLHTDRINKLLRSLSPQMDVTHFQADGTQSKYLPIDEFHERPEREGSLAEAIALQIYKFSMHKGGYKECAECGTIFAERQTKKRKGSPRSSAVFCGDTCRSRNAQRKRRAKLKKEEEAKRALLLSRSNNDADPTTSQS